MNDETARSLARLVGGVIGFLIGMTILFAAYGDEPAPGTHASIQAMLQRATELQARGEWDFRPTRINQPTEHRNSYQAVRPAAPLRIENVSIERYGDTIHFVTEHGWIKYDLVTNTGSGWIKGPTPTHIPTETEPRKRNDGDPK